MTDATNEPDLRGITIAALHPDHAINRFSCGDDGLDKFINKKAAKFHAAHRIKVFCARLRGAGTVCGLYTLAIQSEDSSLLKGDESGNVNGKYFAAVYIGSLAVKKGLHGNGIGTLLLMDALRRSYEISKNAGLVAVALRSVSDETTRLYERFGFDKREAVPMPLMILPVLSLVDLFEGNATTS